LTPDEAKLVADARRDVETKPDEILREGRAAKERVGNKNGI